LLRVKKWLLTRSFNVNPFYSLVEEDVSIQEYNPTFAMACQKFIKRWHESIHG
jgi:hypothetical protein